VYNPGRATKRCVSRTREEIEAANEAGSGLVDGVPMKETINEEVRARKEMERILGKGVVRGY
jgi:hypothetical protein